MIRETLASNCSRGMLDSKTGSGRGPWRLQRRQRAGEPGSNLADGLDGARVGGVDAALVVEVGVGQDRDRVAQVVEGDDHVGEHQRHVRQPEHVRVGLRQALDGAHAVEAEEADGAARERRQAGDLGLADLGDRLVGERVRVSPVGQAPADDALRAPADERVAADLLALLGGLQQEGRAVAAQLQERGDGRLAVLDEGVGDRDEVVVARRARAPPRASARPRGAQRRRATSTSSASARLSPRLRSSTARW